MHGLDSICKSETVPVSRSCFAAGMPASAAMRVLGISGFKTESVLILQSDCSSLGHLPGSMALPQQDDKKGEEDDQFPTPPSKVKHCLCVLPCRRRIGQIEARKQMHVSLSALAGSALHKPADSLTPAVLHRSQWVGHLNSRSWSSLARAVLDRCSRAKGHFLEAPRTLTSPRMYADLRQHGAGMAANCSTYSWPPILGQLCQLFALTPLRPGKQHACISGCPCCVTLIVPC